MPPDRRLLLIGAGHAHLHLIRHASRLRAVGYDVTLVAPAEFTYSGVVSGIAAGGRPEAVGRIDVAHLARPALRHLPTTVTDVDLSARTALTADGVCLDWDLVSLNVGSVSAVPDGLAVAEDVLRIKPLERLVGLRDRLRDAPTGRGHRVTVVGAGASGVELAAQLAARSDTELVRLLDAGDGPGVSLPPAARRRLLALLARRGVEVRTNLRIGSVDADAVRLAHGTRLPHDLAVLSTGLRPPPIATQPPLGGPRGIPVRATLQHQEHDDVYAAGDCADFLPQRLERIGVHGVRQGPVLLAALEARAAGDPAPVYRPRRTALAILDLGGGTALAVRGRWWWLGRTSLWLKRLIDRRWLVIYRP